LLKIRIVPSGFFGALRSTFLAILTTHVPEQLVGIKNGQHGTQKLSLQEIQVLCFKFCTEIEQLEQLFIC